MYSEADRDAPHVRDADEAVLLGPAPARESYLDIERILDAARRSGADAVHPGYGFLSENWRFAEACARAGLTFIGPPAEAIRAMGDKTEARRLMAGRRACRSCPAAPGRSPTRPRPRRAAERIGFPLILKAAGGGGGIGMARVDRADRSGGGVRDRDAARAGGLRQRRRSTSSAIWSGRATSRSRSSATATAPSCTCTSASARSSGATRSSIEESPAPGLTPATKRGLTDAAVAGARAIGYVNAGTMEFLVDAAGGFYFLEMNTRLQVEHPVTEEVTGLDLVRRAAPRRGRRAR